MNPNTGTLPMFRTRIDADITLGIYAATPSSSATTIPTATRGDSPSRTLFHMANDSGLFHQPEISPTPSSTAGPTSATARSTYRCTRRRCSATSTTASPPTAAPPKPNSTSGSLPRLADAGTRRPDMRAARPLLGRPHRSRCQAAGQVGPRLAARLARHRAMPATRAPSSHRCCRPSAVGHMFPLALPGRARPTVPYCTPSGPAWSSITLLGRSSAERT